MLGVVEVEEPSAGADIGEGVGGRVKGLDGGGLDGEPGLLMLAARRAVPLCAASQRLTERGERLNNTCVCVEGE